MPYDAQVALEHAEVAGWALGSPGHPTTMPLPSRSTYGPLAANVKPRRPNSPR